MSQSPLKPYGPMDGQRFRDRVGTGQVPRTNKKYQGLEGVGCICWTLGVKLVATCCQTSPLPSRLDLVYPRWVFGITSGSPLGIPNCYRQPKSNSLPSRLGSAWYRNPQTRHLGSKVTSLVQKQAEGRRPSFGDWWIPRNERGVWSHVMSYNPSTPMYVW